MGLGLMGFSLNIQMLCPCQSLPETAVSKIAKLLGSNRTTRNWGKQGFAAIAQDDANLSLGILPSSIPTLHPLSFVMVIALTSGG